jgi:hypothetical protein
VTEERATPCGGWVWSVAIERDRGAGNTMWCWVSSGGGDNTELEIVGCRVVDGGGNSDHRRSSRSGGGSMVGSG